MGTTSSISMDIMMYPNSLFRLIYHLRLKWTLVNNAKIKNVVMDFSCAFLCRTSYSYKPNIVDINMVCVVLLDLFKIMYWRNSKVGSEFHMGEGG